MRPAPANSGRYALENRPDLWHNDKKLDKLRREIILYSDKFGLEGERTVEDMNKNDRLKAMINTTFYPTAWEDKSSIEKGAKIPYAVISAMGVAFEPLTAIFQKFTGIGQSEKSGLYKVTIPNGGELAKFRDGSGYLGSVLTQNGAVGGGQARINPLEINPAMLCVGLMLASIEKKLDKIQETQQEILEFLERKEKAKLRGNLNVLADVLNNYKHNWDNEKYKTNKHIQVQEIKRDAEQSVIFCRGRIDKKIEKQSFWYSDGNVKDKLEKIQTEFREYQLALYLFAFAAFLEVILLENFEKLYLDSVIDKINEYSAQYQELYKSCYNYIEECANSSLQTNLIKGVANINKVTGSAIAKIPFINKSQIDEALIETGGRLDRFSSKKTEQTMKMFEDSQSSCVDIFTENIKTVNRLYNQPMELFFDEENMYFSLSENLLASVER